MVLRGVHREFSSFSSAQIFLCSAVNCIFSRKSFEGVTNAHTEFYAHSRRENLFYKPVFLTEVLFVEY
jgi:hypothetical protein